MFLKKYKKSKLRIAVMVSARFFIPPPKGAIFAPMFIAKEIAEGLTKKGHRITFFAPKGSDLKVTKVVSSDLEPLYLSLQKTPKIFKDPFVREKEIIKITNLWDQYLLSLLYKADLEKKFDILHLHLVEFALPFSLLSKTPTVYTFHDPLYPWRVRIFNLFKNKNQYFVSISDAQRKSAPNLNWIATIYNGLDLKYFPFNNKPKDYCLFLGRLLSTKGVWEAILAAKKAKEKLIIAGTPAEGEYWEKKIKPYLSENIRYVGNIPYHQTYKYYQKAKVSLMPIQWEEPFGLTFIESMACGSPVIAFDRGSVREVIKDGKTGFVVKNIEQMIEAIKKIDQIDRGECRKWVEEKFTIERMVDDYEKIYYQILNHVRN